VCAPNAPKQRPNGTLDHVRIAGACRARDSDGYFRQRNSPTNYLDNGFIKENCEKSMNGYPCEQEPVFDVPDNDLLIKCAVNDLITRRGTRG